LRAPVECDVFDVDPDAVIVADAHVLGAQIAKPRAGNAVDLEIAEPARAPPVRQVIREPGRCGTKRDGDAARRQRARGGNQQRSAQPAAFGRLRHQNACPMLM